ncbi:MAG: DNA mismatch repair protein MutS [Bulleidia sp.]
MSEEKYSPMMAHYRAVKKQYPDALLFYRLGDFYELFFEDARTVSRELDLVLTGKTAGVKDRVPMCGVPYHAVNSYLQRLVQRGYKIAICEQMQDPKEAVGLVERDVVRVITPGTVMAEISDEKASVYLAAIEEGVYGYALALAEISTGDTFVLHIDHADAVLLQTLLRNNVREVVCPKNFSVDLIKALREAQIVISYDDDTAIKETYLPLFEAITLPADRNACGRMLSYLEETQKHMIGHLSVCHVESADEILAMDYSTLLNLELIEPLHKQGKTETLWTFLDFCGSAMGSRLLRQWIEKPLVKKEAIEKRYDRLAYLKDHFMLRQKMRDCLRNIYDLQRLIGRVSMNSAGPVDLKRLAKTLAQVPDILSCVQDETFQDLNQVDPLANLHAKLADAFVENPPLLLNDGGVFRDGYNAELDEARKIQHSGRAFISSLEADYREKTGIKNLKIGYNKVFGYFIEISKGQLAAVKAEWGWVRKQTLVNNERFISDELKEKEDQILHAQENAIRIEKQLFSQLLQAVQDDLVPLKKLALVLAQLDVLAALAQASATYGYVRPQFTDDEFQIEGGRHPILDECMKEPRYVSNSIHMNRDQFILLITGPNMGGKSTYMRQTALIVLMAQMGCYVPAKRCRMPLFDQIFTRIGASDDILSGQSTFMVEMNEANLALQQATSRSLILFDEIGRGTSTYDGMALAQAMLEYIASCLHAKTMFSTHYHELTALSQSVPCVKNVHVAVHEEQAQITFLYKIKDGNADRSYGINVARLAGLPEAVLNRAEVLQKELESKKRVVQQSYQLVEMPKEDPISKAVLKRLNAIRPDDLSPRQAWTMLDELVRIVQKKESN